MDADRYIRIVRLSAFYDLVVTAAFVTPASFAVLHWVVWTIDSNLGLPGIVPAPDPLTVLLGNLLGSVVVVWSLARLHLGQPILGRYDAVARLLFALWQIYAMASGVSLVILPLTVFEILFGVLQAMPVRKPPIATVAA